MEKKDGVAITMEKKDAVASINRSDPSAMEKKNVVAIAMEKKDAVASIPTVDGVQDPAIPAADGV
jgi:hypothetical protein